MINGFCKNNIKYSCINTMKPYHIQFYLISFRIIPLSTYFLLLLLNQRKNIVMETPGGQRQFLVTTTK